MPDSFEVLIWGAVMAALWLRGLSRTAQRRRAAELAQQQGELEGAGVTAEPSVRRQATPAGGRDAGGGRKSLREQWAAIARELQEQSEAARVDAARREGALRPSDEERTVLVPGRRVSPASPPSVPDVAPSSPATASSPWRDPISHHADIKHRTPRLDVQRTRRKGVAGGHALDRLDRFSPLQRAMILSEIFGAPPGLARRDRDPKH